MAWRPEPLMMQHLAVPSAAVRGVGQSTSSPQVLDHQMRASTLRIRLAADVNHKAEVSIGSRLHPEMASSTTTVSLGSASRSFRGGLPGKSLCLDHIALDPHLEEVVQLGGPQDAIAVFTGGDGRNFEPFAAELLNQSHGRRKAPRPPPR
jgi:hypothetical protein